MSDESPEILGNTIEMPPDAPPFADTWRSVMTDPRAFFAGMPTVGGLNDPLVFLAICAAINAAGVLLVTWSVFATIGAFIWTVAAGFILAAILTVVTQQLFGGRAGFEPVFRIVAYAMAPAVFFWLPRLGVLAWIYSWYLQVRGLERVQEFDATHAVLSVAVSAFVALVLGAGLRGWF
ncbi:MAG TPA: YIP1 family protein [Candidatus Binatia bacterium]|jgi:hypothetical protein|nr:YIP1 family protein [Candidatus Binatia bacterium]